MDGPVAHFHSLLAMTRSNLKLFTPFMVNPLTLVIARVKPVAIHCESVIEPYCPIATLRSRWIVASLTLFAPRNDRSLSQTLIDKFS